MLVVGQEMTQLVHFNFPVLICVDDSEQFDGLPVLGRHLEVDHHVAELGTGQEAVPVLPAVQQHPAKLIAKRKQAAIIKISPQRLLGSKFGKASCRIRWFTPSYQC